MNMTQEEKEEEKEEEKIQFGIVIERHHNHPTGPINGT